MHDLRYSDLICPECDHHPTHTRPCPDPKCERGRIDLYRENAVLHPYGPGKKYRKCRRCDGNGHLHWCPECGENLNDHDDLRTARRDLRDYG